MTEPEKTSATDDLSAEFDAIVTKEQADERRGDAAKSAEGNAVPVTVKKTEEPVLKKEAADTAPAVESTHENTPATLILQWLSYAFWGWFALAMVWLVGVVVSWLVDRDGVASEIGDVLPYPMAASIILAVIALVVDVFYSRVEPAKKKGVASAIMIIHAVIFALCGIGALIAAVFAVIYSSLNAGVFGGANGAKVIMITALIMMVVYGLLTARTVFGTVRRKLKYISWGVLATLLVLMAGIGVFGPVGDALVTKQDRLIESALPSLVSSINSYTDKNNRLPADLNALSGTSSSYRSEEMNELIKQKLVRYTPNSKPVLDQKQSSSSSKSGVSVDEYYKYGGKSYYYRLCVTYKREKNAKYDDYVTPASDGSQTYISTSSHPAGEKCYDMKTSSYGY